MKTPHFYAVIIGSEILNGRRIDKHFDFVRDALLHRGHVLFSTFIIKDDRELIHSIYTLIKKDPNGVMFSFGGIGSTPDDLTRQIASDVFSDGILVSQASFYTDILERFGDQAFPHRITMAMLPSENTLIEVMEKLNPSVDFSSLPMINNGIPTVEISIASPDKTLCDDNFNLFIHDLTNKSILFKVL